MKFVKTARSRDERGHYFHSDWYPRSNVPHNQVLSYGATVHFVLMDYDFLKNDFGGEAYLQINDVPGVHGKKSKNLGEESPISLHLLPGVTKGTEHFFINNNNIGYLYSANIHHAWCSRRSNYYPGSARQPILVLTAFKEFIPTGSHLTPGWRVANVG